MTLPIPSVGTEPGPDYALDVNSCLTIIDQHNHSAGSGIQITNDGINITDAFTLNSNFLIDSAGMTLIAQLSTPSNKTVYVSGVDLYYVDGSGNNIRLTASGSIAGSSGSISGLASPASATYVSGSQTFVWQSGSAVAANMDFGSAIMRNLSPNSTFAVTLSPIAALGSNYNLVLPPLPASQKIMTLDASGNITAPYTVDGTTLTIVSNVIGVPDGGISGAKLAAGAAVSNIATGTITGSMLTSGAAAANLGYTPVQTVTAGTGLSGGGSGQTLTLNVVNTAGAVGTYVMGWLNNGGSLNFGDTFSGTLIQPSSATGETVGSALSGTWKCMGMAQGGAGTQPGNSVSLFVRIS